MVAAINKPASALSTLIACLTVPLIACLGAPSTTHLPPASDLRRIASSLPTGGPLISEARAIRGAIDLAVAEANLNPKANIRWEHLALDGSEAEGREQTGEKERENAKLAVSDPNVVAYIGPYSSAAAEHSLPVTNRASLLQLGPTNTWPGLTESGWESGEPDKYYPTGIRTYARVMPSDSAQARALADWVTDEGHETVSVFRDGSTYSDGLAHHFTLAAKSHGLEVVVQERIISADDLRLDRFHTPGNGALFYAPSNGGTALRFVRSLDSTDHRDSLFMTDTALSEQMLELPASATQGLRIMWNGVEQLPLGIAPQRFRDAFRARTGHEVTQYAANAYDLATLVIQAAQFSARPDRETVTRIVMSTRNYDGASGEITFSEAGENIEWRMTGYTVVNERFKLARVFRSR